MAAAPIVVERRGLGRALRLSHPPSVVLGISVAIVLLMVLAAILAPLIAPHDPNQIKLAGAFEHPGADALLGRDSSGRDILSRLIYGARLSLLGPLFVVLVAGLIGIPLGLAAGYAGGWADGIVSRVFDLMFAFPALLLAILIVATFGTGFSTAVIAVAITYIPLMGRVVRSGALVERGQPYVDACRLQGFGPVRICARHITPNLFRLIVSQTAVYFGYALLDLAALSFLGLGTQPPTADWGSMLANANQGIFDSPTGVIPASVAIVMLVVSFNLIADWLADRSEGERR
jgi:peptide/nickel transport system permease protein